MAEKMPEFLMSQSVSLRLARKFSKFSLRSTWRGGVQLNCHQASTEVAMPKR